MDSSDDGDDAQSFLALSAIFAPRKDTPPGSGPGVKDLTVELADAATSDCIDVLGGDTSTSGATADDLAITTAREQP